MFFQFKDLKIYVHNISMQIELSGCTNTQLFCDFCNQHIYNKSYEYSSVHLAPCITFIKLFKKAKYIKQIDGKLVVIPDENRNPIDLSQVFKQPKQVVYKEPLTLSQANQEEYYNSYVYSNLNWHHTDASL